MKSLKDIIFNKNLLLILLYLYKNNTGENISSRPPASISIFFIACL